MECDCKLVALNNIFMIAIELYTSWQWLSIIILKVIWNCQWIEYMIWRQNLATPLFHIFLERESALSVEKDRVANVNTSLIGSESRKHTDMKNNIIAINDKELCS